MKKLLLSAAAILVVSCGSDNQSVSVGNNNPLGTVGGVVIDAASEMPLMGAMVSLVAGGKSLTATTDMNGLFSVANVPSSANFIATVSNMGYESAMVNGTLNGAVGNFPVKDPVTTIGPIGLVKNDGTFAVKIEDQFGAPVANVAVTARTSIRWVNFSNGSPQVMGSYEIAGTSGMDGVVMLAGLPNFAALGTLGFNSNFDQVFITVAPIQVMGSTTIYSFLGGTFEFDVGHLTNNGGVVDQPIIRLAGPDTALSILNSNLDVLRGITAGTTGTPIADSGAAAPDTARISTYGFTAVNGPITAEFNQVINKSTIRAQLFDELGQQSSISLMAVGNNNLLTITPMSALTAGTRYNLALHVDANVVAGQNNVARELNVTVPIFSAPASGTTPKVLLSSTKYTVDTAQNVFVDIIFSEPIGPGFGATQPISCMAYYELQGQSIDNDPKLSAGEWPAGSTTGIGTTCPAAGLDITAVQPIEPNSASNPLPVTGYSAHWRVRTDAAGHPECIVQGGCIFPSPPPTMHILFSHLSGQQVIKRPDGTPVADNLMNFQFTPVAGP